MDPVTSCPCRHPPCPRAVSMSTNRVIHRAGNMSEADTSQPRRPVAGPGCCPTLPPPGPGCSPPTPLTRGAPNPRGRPPGRHGPPRTHQWHSSNSRAVLDGRARPASARRSPASWLLLTAAMFLVSAVIYGARLARVPRHPEPTPPATGVGSSPTDRSANGADHTSSTATPSIATPSLPIPPTAGSASTTRTY